MDKYKRCFLEKNTSAYMEMACGVDIPWVAFGGDSEKPIIIDFSWGTIAGDNRNFPEALAKLDTIRANLDKMREWMLEEHKKIVEKKNASDEM